MGNKGSQPEEAAEDYSQPHASAPAAGSGYGSDGRRQGAQRGGGHGGAGKQHRPRAYEEPAPVDMGLPPPPPPEDSRVERPWKKEPSREGTYCLRLRELPLFDCLFLDTHAVGMHWLYRRRALAWGLPGGAL